MRVPRRRLSGWAEDARAAITTNPNYFVAWYTAKSFALVAAVAVAAYYMGKNATRINA